MSGFIYAASGYRRIPISDVSEIDLVDGWWRATLKNGGVARVGQGEFGENAVDLATSRIVAANPNEEIHIFYLDDAGRLKHNTDKVIAWSLDISYPSPITLNGLRKFGLSGAELVCFKTASGDYDDQVTRIYRDEDEIIAELKEQQAAREAERGPG